MRLLYLLLPFLHFLSATDVPIIGILSQETYSVDHLFPDNDYRSFIAASYVKYLESSGARVAPIMIGQDVDYYKRVINYTNGNFQREKVKVYFCPICNNDVMKEIHNCIVCDSYPRWLHSLVRKNAQRKTTFVILFPGGATWFNESGGYGDAGQIIFDLALEINRNGDYYPIWGTCLGMELLAQVAIGGTEIRAHCSATKLSIPLELKEDFGSSKMFGSTPQDILRILSKENVTYNSHNYCFTEEIFQEYGLLEDWRVLSLNKDVNGFEFISTFESKRYPFYGIQFHAEKNRFEVKLNTNIPHSVEAVAISQYFANFFVEETRKNNHSYPDWKTEQEALIYNYDPVFTGLLNSTYMQLYLFTEVDVNKNYEVLKL